MPITHSAKKAHRSSLRKRDFNSYRKNQVARSLKALKKLITTGKRKEAEKMMREVQKTLDKAVKGKTLNKNTASRKKSRLVKMIKKLA